MTPGKRERVRCWRIVACNETTVHGDLKDRRYVERNEVLATIFDPSTHLTRAANGLLTWTPTAPFGLRYAIRSHFANRREDG